MRARWRRIGAVAVLAAVPLAIPAGARADDADLARGAAFVAEHCTACHSIDPAQASPHAEAPPLHGLAHRYPIEHLAEALAEGITVGHDDMPEFALELAEIAAVLAYLASIQY